MSADDYYLIRLHPDHSTYPPETNPRFIITSQFASSDSYYPITDKLLASLDPTTDLFPSVDLAISTICRHNVLGVGRYSPQTEYGIEVHPECFPPGAFESIDHSAPFPPISSAYPLPEPSPTYPAFPVFTSSNLDEVVKYYSRELERIYEKRTAGDFTFTEVLVEFYHAMINPSPSPAPKD